MAFLNYMGVDVFPITNTRGGEKGDSHYLREYRLTDWISSLLDKKSFVVTSHNGFSLNDDNTLEFVIDGYYFKVQNSALRTLISEFSSSTTDIHAYAVKYANFVLGDDDVNSKFVGLYITNTDTPEKITIQLDGEPITDPELSDPLHILTKVGGNYIIPLASKVKLTSCSIDNIDGGIV